MKKATPGTMVQFLNSYRKNFIVFLEVILSILPVILIAVCGLSIGVFLFSQKIKYLYLFFGTLIGAPLLQTASERLGSFFAKHTRHQDN